MATQEQPNIELQKQYMRENAKFIEQSIKAGSMTPCNMTPAQPSQERGNQHA